MRGTRRLGARVYASHTDYAYRRFEKNPLRMQASKSREGHMKEAPSAKARRSLHVFANEPSERARLTRLPGVEFESDLPADPLTRIFFQRKGSNALFQGTYEDPNNIDQDRVEIKDRRVRERMRNITSAVYDFCHRVREASEQRKRFVIVPSTHETKGAADILMAHGLIAGFRDFFNERAFVVELKYFQNESVLNEIIPASSDLASEAEWTPQMIRKLRSAKSWAGGIRVYIMRTWDGRIIDHHTAAREGIGGRALLFAY